MEMKSGSERAYKLQDWKQTEMAGDSHEGGSVECQKAGICRECRWVTKLRVPRSDWDT